MFFFVCGKEPRILNNRVLCFLDVFMSVENCCFRRNTEKKFWVAEVHQERSPHTEETTVPGYTYHFFLFDHNYFI